MAARERASCHQRGTSQQPPPPGPCRTRPTQGASVASGPIDCGHSPLAIHGNPREEHWPRASSESSPQRGELQARLASGRALRQPARTAAMAQGHIKAPVRDAKHQPPPVAARTGRQATEIMQADVDPPEARGQPGPGRSTQPSQRGSARFVPERCCTAPGQRGRAPGICSHQNSEGGISRGRGCRRWCRASSSSSHRRQRTRQLAGLKAGRRLACRGHAQAAGSTVVRTDTGAGSHVALNQRTAPPRVSITVEAQGAELCTVSPRRGTMAQLVGNEATDGVELVHRQRHPKGIVHRRRWWRHPPRGGCRRPGCRRRSRRRRRRTRPRSRPRSLRARPRW